MDKTWMLADKRSLRFEIGFENFLKVASDNAKDPNNIPCLCLKCCNNGFGSIQFIKDHVFFNGIMENYDRWKWHRECSYAARHGLSEGSETVEMNPDLGIEVDDVGNEDEELSADSNEFMQFVEDGDKPLYPGCTKATKINGLIETFNLKVRYGLSDSCYSDILILFETLLPDGNELPGSVKEAKKILSTLGMEYEKIDACPNDCILYRGLHVAAQRCPTCTASRWKLAKDKSERVGVSAKTLWYFPPIPRFRRMFQSTFSAKQLTWHAKGRKKDGMMRHPADSPMWKMIDTKWPDFGIEPRNLRLALSSDEFNPFGAANSKYSCWPVILVTYNLPPWLCMKMKYMMLTLLISGPKQPGNDIDVYLQPLVDDLKVLWDGVERVYDAVRGEYFKLKAVLFWTINDFPAYGNLSGSIVKGYNACPICVDQTKPYRLKKSNKMGFLRNQKWLPRYHLYRKQASAFDNTIENDDALAPLTGEETFARVQGLPKANGKKNSPAPYKGPAENRPCWKKKSVFFELEYWKTKDGIAARLDMVEMGIGTDLKPTNGAKRDKLPLASWNLLLDERKIVCDSFSNMKGPARFSSIWCLITQVLIGPYRLWIPT